MKMGLYNCKYQVRKLMEKLVFPSLANINPNYVTLSLLPLGLATAWVFALGHFLLGAILIVLRMFLGTLDGFIAERYQKSTPLGAIFNRLIPEIADTLLLAALAWRDPFWGIAALCVSWLISFSGLIGLAIQKPIQSIGPVGQVDRLAALIALSLCTLLPFAIDWMHLFLIWCTFGGAVTICLRLKKHFEQDERTPRSSPRS